MDHKSHFHTFHISLLDIAANLQLFRPSIPFLLAKSVYFCTTFSPLKQYTIYSNWTWWFRSNRPKKSRWWILPEPNYKELYFKLFRAVEDAIDILITAQRDCEELYLSTGEDAAGSEVSWHSSSERKKTPCNLQGVFLELLNRFELSTSSLPRKCSACWATTAYLICHQRKNGDPDGARTHDL